MSKVGRYSLNSSSGRNIDGKEEEELELKERKKERKTKKADIPFRYPQLR